jgi:hypothetical protein
MSSDLIEHFKLDAQVHNDHTVHIEPARGMRRAKIEKKWYREKYLGHGAFGDVWLEAQRDADHVTKRAVKLIQKRRMQTVGIDYRRELLALAKLSRVRTIEMNSDVVARLTTWNSIQNSL